MTISQLARHGGVNVETVRYYQRVGLLRIPERPLQGFRSYDDRDATHLRFIRHGQMLGFTLDELASLIHLSSVDCKEAERIAEDRLVSVRAKIADLRRFERALARTVSGCRLQEAGADCPLLEELLT